MTVPKFRSKFEENTYNILGDDWEYEPSRFPYTMERKYVPDFVRGNTWIEVKGYFRAGDVGKYKAIRKSNPTVDLVFVFSDPNKKVRKGAKLTMGDWAVKNGWRYCTLKDLEVFINE